MSKSRKTKLIIASLFAMGIFIALIVIKSCNIPLNMNSIGKNDFEKYAEISFAEKFILLSENDDYSSSFMDGQYSVSFKTDANGIKKLLSIKPNWADCDWVSGRVKNLAVTFNITETSSMKSLKGEHGNSVFRILTLDPSTNTVYFELKEY
jgi:hypothetical protein